MVGLFFHPFGSWLANHWVLLQWCKTGPDGIEPGVDVGICLLALASRFFSASQSFTVLPVLSCNALDILIEDSKFLQNRAASLLPGSRFEAPTLSGFDFKIFFSRQSSDHAIYLLCSAKRCIYRRTQKARCITTSVESNSIWCRIPQIPIESVNAFGPAPRVSLSTAPSRSLMVNQIFGAYFFLSAGNLFPAWESEGFFCLSVFFLCLQPKVLADL